MKTDYKKLLAYSSSAFAFLLTSNNSESQVIYHDLDPDIVLSPPFLGEDSYSLDFNGDGITDIRFMASIDWWDWASTLVWYTTEAIGIDNFLSVVKNPTYWSLYGAKPLDEGYAINSACSWTNLDHMELQVATRVFAWGNTGVDFYYNYWLQENKYIGVKFLIDGLIHFGWVRLSIPNYTDEGALPKMILQDFAYEATANTAITISNPKASCAEELLLQDATEYQNASDLHLTFNRADNESTVSAYRIFLVKSVTGTPYVPPSISELETLPADRYIEIAPTGAPDYSVIFPSTMKDKNGNPILTDYPNYYQAIILSIADGTMVTENNVSAGSNWIKIEAKAVVGPYSLDITTTTDQCDISDFTVTFHKGSDETGIAAYRVFIINGDHDLITETDSNYYMTVIPDGSNVYSVQFDPDKIIFEDSVPILFQNYYTEIITIADSLYATIGDFSSTQYYETYYGGTDGKEVEYYCPIYDHPPVLSFNGISKTTADIRVKFHGPKKLAELLQYRIYILPEEDVANFDNQVAADIPLANCYKILAASSELDINLPIGVPDIYGNPIAMDKRYVVMIGLVQPDNQNELSVSLPSAPFNFISDEAHLPLPNSYIYEDMLYVISGSDLPYHLNLYNMAGEKVLDYLISKEITIIDLSEIPSGTYILKSSPDGEIPVNKIFIGSRAK